MLTRDELAKLNAPWEARKRMRREHEQRLLRRANMSLAVVVVLNVIVWGAMFVAIMWPPA